MKIKFREIKNKGLGVVAIKKIVAGEVFEEAPVILYRAEEEEYLEKTALGNYTYAWESQWGAIVLGYGSLYNHSYHPNARYERDFAGKSMQYIALCDIEAGEEITINYNGRIEDLSPTWFEVF
ncbi:hypothetical protein SPSIL_033040 [Sporomusa silvacetica DSM 10669]|uniref:SET domain-containing protein n=1 Tax=Sporomusa silvacetica DSM 10669 TaxID=1123289 RepID=A0ABZ3INH4_9FIRM|nr:SET domain-containing protein [Sporomusa silvacetica]OZC18061.1 SET domain protein [Sporomusa silvacetica DSM 10669]